MNQIEKEKKNERKKKKNTMNSTLSKGLLRTNEEELSVKANAARLATKNMTK